ncbi:helix-turn-helix domain-containing protein [Acetivibrio mesophilus]|uniref:Helix-turn-helix domain-containing protein n=1 Tax=Acetivibrio mesophilus TaxID=2487273 RepID=A0A4V1K2K0_9FIRM|nr:helix-turn-helix domain-containing protein [Acetivibrio mesophilus]RXE60559.1 helix-turn-helix domain-containing protein [Acetivibrio mesophilus]
MDTAKTIKELREGTGMSRKEFSEHTGIPVLTLEDWEAARRTPRNIYQDRRENTMQIL